MVSVSLTKHPVINIDFILGAVVKSVVLRSKAMLSTQPSVKGCQTLEIIVKFNRSPDIGNWERQHLMPFKERAFC